MSTYHKIQFHPLRDGDMPGLREEGATIMEISHYLSEYAAFCKEFDIPTTPEARSAKLLDETDEYALALLTGTHDDVVSEALDVMNVAIANVVALGMSNPLFSGWQKLQKNAERYRKEKQDVERSATATN